MPSFRNILLIHFGQLGDSVLALPAAQALRNAFPTAPLVVLSSPRAAAIYSMAGFTNLWPVDRAAWKRNPLRAAFDIPRLIVKLRNAHFDLSVDLHSYKETNLLAWVAGIPNRVAMLRPTRSYARLINRKPPADNPDGVLLDRYCTVLEPLGIEVDKKDRLPKLSPPPVATRAVSTLFEPFTGALVLGIFPGAGNPSRRWPADHFADVARRLGQAVAVFPGPEESAATMAPFRDLPNARVITVMRPEELAAALARCRVVLSNDSGPAHIAAAVGTRVVVIGAIPQFEPVGNVRVVRAVTKVSDISVESVFEAVTQSWAESE